MESEFLEIKGWCNDERQLTEKLADAASCLANAEGGVVLVGIGEGSNQKFSRCPFPNLSAAWLVARVQDNTHPPVDCRGLDLTRVLADVWGTADANVFALQVQRKKCLSGHATSKGVSRVRSGKECKPLFISEDDRTRMVVPDATTDDLAIGSIQWAMGQHNRHFRTAETFADCWDFLARGGLLRLDEADSGRVTLAALLLFGKDAAFSRRSIACETVINTHGDYRTFRKNIIESLREVILSERAVLKSALPTIPETTLRELVVNAYAHRCWRTNGPVLLTVSGTAFDIQNPGDLLAGLHVGNLLYGVPVYRNFLLAEGMRFAGLSDKIGQGIDLVFKTVLSGGFDFPVFESSNGTFRASIPLARSEEFREFVRRRGTSLSQLDELVVLRYLWGAGEADFKHLSDALQRGRDIARRIVQAMEKKQMIETVGGMFSLTHGLRLDVERSFNADQLDLFGAA